jgi:hypothetical protein
MNQSDVMDSEGDMSAGDEERVELDLRSSAKAASVDQSFAN